MKDNSKIFIIAVFLAASGLSLHAQQASWYPTVHVEKQQVPDVPFVPTPPEVVSEMLRQAGVNSKDVLYDLGCGDGRIVVTAAKELKVRRAVGVDIDPKRIEESNENARQAGMTGKVTFLQKDLFDIDLRDATVVSLYLLPSVNLKLRPKLLKELKPGSRIVSHDFNMGDWQPDREAEMKEHTIFYWLVPANASGTWNWSLNDGSGPRAFKLQVRQHFQNVYRAELKVDGIETPVRTIKITGDKLEFTAGGGASGLREQLQFTGSVRGNAIRGTISGGESGARRKTRWIAQRKKGTEMPLDSSSPFTNIEI